VEDEGEGERERGREEEREKKREEKRDTPVPAAGRTSQKWRRKTTKEEVIARKSRNDKSQKEFLLLFRSITSFN
jgi:hypothetical protein